MEGDGIYFGRRAKEERVAAMKAPHSQARKAHLEMADRYDDLAAAIVSRERAWNRNGRVPAQPRSLTVTASEKSSL